MIGRMPVKYGEKRRAYAETAAQRSARKSRGSKSAANARSRRRIRSIVALNERTPPPAGGEGLLSGESAALNVVLCHEDRALSIAGMKADLFAAREEHDVVIDVFFVAKRADVLPVLVLHGLLEAGDVEERVGELVLGFEMRVQPRDDVVGALESVSTRLQDKLQHTILGDAVLRGDRFLVDTPVDRHVPNRLQLGSIFSLVDDDLRRSAPDGAETRLEEPEIVLVMTVLDRARNGRSICLLDQVFVLTVKHLYQKEREALAREFHVHLASFLAFFWLKVKESPPWFCSGRPAIQ